MLKVTEIQEKLKPHQLNVNTDKTEYTIIQRFTDKDQERQWRTTKKVGSLIGDVEDVNRRKSLSMVALNKINNVWIRKDKIKQATRIKLYNARSVSTEPVYPQNRMLKKNQTHLIEMRPSSLDSS